MIGGIGRSNGLLDSIEILDLAAQTSVWLLTQPTNFVPKSAFSTARISDHEIVIIGGNDQKCVQILDIEQNSSTTVVDDIGFESYFAIN